MADTATSAPEQETKLESTQSHEPSNSEEAELSETDKPPEWVEWRETSDSGDPSDSLPNGELQVESAEPAKSSELANDSLVDNDEIAAGYLAASKDESQSSAPPEPSKSVVETPSSESTASDETATIVLEVSHEAAASDKAVDKEGN